MVSCVRGSVPPAFERVDARGFERSSAAVSLFVLKRAITLTSGSVAAGLESRSVLLPAAVSIGSYKLRPEESKLRVRIQRARATKTVLARNVGHTVSSWSSVRLLWFTNDPPGIHQSKERAHLSIHCCSLK
jgi:hypothetical protein